jgi:hypothetical protein
MTTDPAASVHDRVAIQDVLSIYCRGIDRLDESLIAAAYWPDASEDHGIFKGRAKDFAPWIVKFLDQTYRATAHRLGQSYVVVCGVRASAETYFSSQHHLRSADGGAFESVDGRYIDEFQKRDGVWRISSRVVVLDFVRQFTADIPDIAKIPGLTFGQRGRGDYSYSVV